MRIEQAERIYEDLVDEHFPLGRFSPQDRLNILLSYLQLRNPQGFKLKSDHRRAHVSASAVYDLLVEKAGAVRRQDDMSGERPLLDNIDLEIHESDPQSKSILEAIRLTYQQLCKRKGSMLIEVQKIAARGYRVVDFHPDDSTSKVHDPRLVGTFSDLVAALVSLRAHHHNPPWRTMEARSAQVVQGLNGPQIQPRSHSSMARAVKPGAEPTLVSVLAFVRGCGLFGTSPSEEWADAHAKAVFNQRMRGRT